MSDSWDSLRAKTQIRVAAQRLGQLQDRKDSLAPITSRDIATLLGQRNVSLARAKALNLLKEDAAADVMEVLEMYCSVVQERFSELEKDGLQLHPATIEAISSIIYASAYTECHELNVLRDMLIARVGSDYTESAIHNKDGHVPQRILRAMHRQFSAAEVDEYLEQIAKKFGVPWKAQLRSDDKIVALSEMLDASDIMGTVDIEKLRLICSTGLPVETPWLRPRVWKLLFGLTSLTKVRWESENQKMRENYYELVSRVLANTASLPLPADPPSSPDRNLLNLIGSLAQVPAYLFNGLDEEIEPSSVCPVNENAAENVKIKVAFSLDARLQLLQGESDDNSSSGNSAVMTPEIRLDTGSAPTSPTKGYFDLSKVAQEGESSPSSRTLSLSNQLAPKAFRKIPAHPSHVSALLRLLFVHKSLNPGVESPHVASLLVPVYGVMTQEADNAELAHAEADAFWVFEALLRDVSELEDPEGGMNWMRKFHGRLSLVDNELLEDLTRKGLDPALPQYSYRWLSPLLSHTLPLRAVLISWDAVFSQPEIEKGTNHRLEHLLDICTAMLVRARALLLLLGKNRPKSPSLWDTDTSQLEPLPLKPWELGDAFMEGMTLLQQYPIEEAGGIERILQVAGDIQSQREELAKRPQTNTLTLGAKLRETVWKGFTNQANSPEDSPPDSDDSDTETEVENQAKQIKKANGHSASSSASGWASYLRTTVIRGITNQSAMETSPVNSTTPSPLPSPAPLPPVDSAPPSPLSPAVPEKDKTGSYLSPQYSGSGLWGYAEKLKQSDVAARLSKASTNLSAKALDAWSTRSASNPTPPVPTVQIDNHSVLPHDNELGTAIEKRPGRVDHSDYTPPPMPTFFKPPRDTRLFTPEELASINIPGSPESSSNDSGSSTTSAHSRVGSLAAALPVALPTTLPSLSDLLPSTSKPKSAPRPLLLRASPSVSPSPETQRSRSANSTPISETDQWSEIMRKKSQELPNRQRDSQFSQSSVSSRPSSVLTSPGPRKNGWDSDTSVSRIVPLNRNSMSPMAPAFRAHRARKLQESVSSQSEFGLPSTPRWPPSQVIKRGTSAPVREEPIPPPDSPSTGPASPPPATPVSSMTLTQPLVNVPALDQQDPQQLIAKTDYVSFPAIEPVPQAKKLQRRVAAPIRTEGVINGSTGGDTSDSSVAPATSSHNRSSRVRTKRYGPQPRSSLRDGTSPIERIVSPASGGGASPSTLAAPEFDSEFELVSTPRAAQFPSPGTNYFSSTSPVDRPRSPRRRKSSNEDPERRRKVSGDGVTARTRKHSNENRTARASAVDSIRRSVAEDGDDEGYDEFLSAYESEENSSRDGHAWSSEA